MTFDEWYYSLHELDQVMINYADAFSGWVGAQQYGIKTHEGQKLLVQHILDTDSGLSDSSRVVLEKLIEE
jgi:hypothetical protein